MKWRVTWNTPLKPGWNVACLPKLRAARPERKWAVRQLYGNRFGNPVGRTLSTRFSPICATPFADYGALLPSPRRACLRSLWESAPPRTIFSALDGVLLKPLPYPQSDRLVALEHTAPGIGIKELNMAPSLYFTYKEESRVLQDVTIWTDDSWTLTGSAEPEQVRGLSVSHEFFRALGVKPALGRVFTPADDVPASERAVMVSHSFWKSRFGGDRSILGRRLRLDGDAYTVVGVLPPTFRFMDRRISLIAPLRFNRSQLLLVQFCCQGMARLKPGATLADADADVARMLPLAVAKFPMNPAFSATLFHDARVAPRLKLLKDVLVGNVRGDLWVLMGTVGILLAIASANVANLMLVRTDSRRQELATRAALGAGRWRIAREVLLESVLVSSAGGVVGVALAVAALQCFTASAAAPLPRMEEISIDSAVLAFAACTSLLTGILFGLVSVLRYVRPELGTELRSAGRSMTGSRTRRRAHATLVSVQVALALVLLVGSGLMIRTALVLHRIDPGFSGAANVQTARVDIPDTQVKDPERVARLEEEILRRISSIPGVSKAGIIDAIPLDGGSNDPVYAEGWSPQGGLPPIRRFKFISPAYISAIGSRLVAGRDLTWADLYGRAPVALISENMAREIWGRPAAALGKHVRGGLKGEWKEVVGVVADLRDDGIDRPAPSIVYWPLLLRNFEGPNDSIERSVAYVIRTPRAGSTALSREMRQAVAAVNASLPLADVKTLQSVYQQSLARTSWTLMLLGIAGAMALILGVVGIYGTISFSVAQRTREIGIRLALGSSAQDITGMFIRQAFAETGAGLRLRAGRCPGALATDGIGAVRRQSGRSVDLPYGPYSPGAGVGTGQLSSCPQGNAHKSSGSASS